MAIDVLGRPQLGDRTVLHHSDPLSQAHRLGLIIPDHQRCSPRCPLRLAERAVDFIRRRRDEPFFLYVAFNAVHTPMHAKPETEATFTGIDDPWRRALAAMTVSLDEGVARVLDWFRARP